MLSAYPFHQKKRMLCFSLVGGKPHKAKAFCSSCEVEGKCLLWALEKNMEGFFSGTTKEERKQMAALRNIEVVDDTLEEISSEIPLAVIKAPEPYEYLDRLEPTDEEIFGLEPAISLTPEPVISFVAKTKQRGRTTKKQLVFT
jgi:hypothetical protein